MHYYKLLRSSLLFNLYQRHFSHLLMPNKKNSVKPPLCLQGFSLTPNSIRQDYNIVQMVPNRKGNYPAMHVHLSAQYTNGLS